MSIPTCVLVRTANDHLFIGTVGVETYLKIDTTDVKLAEELAKLWLNLRSGVAESLAVSGHVLTETQIPGGPFRPGDLMAGDRIQSVAVQRDGEKPATVTPELADPIFERQAALDRRIARLSVGFHAEWAAPAVDKQPKGDETDTSPPPFSMGQEVYPSTSPAWVASRPFWVAHLEAVLDEPGTTATQIAVRINDEIKATVTLPAGVKRRLVRVQRGIERGGYLTMECTVAGTSAAKLTATARGAMI